MRKRDHTPTSPENSAKIGPVQSVIIRLTEIIKGERDETSAEYTDRAASRSGGL